MKSQNFFELCKKASELLRKEFPAPRIAHTVDLFPGLLSHEREALMLQELRNLPLTREQAMKQHYERLLAIRNKAIDNNNYHMVQKANLIIKKWTPIMNTIGNTFIGN
jgi:hypothetical protein